MNVYFVRAGNRGAIKVGVAMNVDRRISTMQTGNPFKLNLLASIPCDSRVSAYALEAKIHKFFARQRIRGEWFQGNIDFRKIGGNMIDVDSTKSSPDCEKSAYQPKKKVKKKRTIRKFQTVETNKQ